MTTTVVMTLTMMAMVAVRARPCSFPRLLDTSAVALMLMLLMLLMGLVVCLRMCWLAGLASV